MDVTTTTLAPVETDADTVVLGVLAGKGIPHDLPGGELQALVDAGEARPTPGHVAVTHAGGRRWVLVGLGERDGLDAEGARRAAAHAHDRAVALGARRLCWELPHRLDDDVAGAFAAGTVLAGHRVDELRSTPREDARELEALVVSDHADRAPAVERAVLVARAQNAARRLQDLPANVCTPDFLAARARELAVQHEHLTVDVLGPGELAERGMGALLAVAQGAATEPRLIALTLRTPGASGPRLGLVGKAVTFDTGGLWLKPNASLTRMKTDMSGGASVLEAVGAIAGLGLPVDLVAVLGATENALDGASMRPGDVVTTAAGLTVQIDNTDAEGRLVLADCLHHAIGLGAERLVDLATLTGAAVSALGKVHCALLSDDDGWCAEIEGAAAAAGERLWRLPLHPDYAKQLEGSLADLVNHVEGRPAGAIIAAEFLHAFTAGVPWAHIDVTAATDAGLPYAKAGGAGWGVRTLVELAARAGVTAT